MNQNKPCNEELLTLYHYGELSGTETRNLELHLQDCSACQENLKELQKGLAAVPTPHLQFSEAQRRSFTEKVSRRVQKRSKSRAGIWGGALAAAAMVAAILLLRPAELPVPPVPGQPAMADFEMLEQLELLQELDLLRDLELLQEMEQWG